MHPAVQAFVEANPHAPCTHFAAVFVLAENDLYPRMSVDWTTWEGWLRMGGPAEKIARAINIEDHSDLWSGPTTIRLNLAWTPVVRRLHTDDLSDPDIGDGWHFVQSWTVDAVNRPDDRAGHSYVIRRSRGLWHITQSSVGRGFRNQLLDDWTLGWGQRRDYQLIPV